MILGTIAQIGTDGANGHVVEYAGEAVRGLSMEGRMTIANMSIEAGARAGMIAPDDTTFAYLEGRPGVPADFAAAVERLARRWRSDEGAEFDRTVDVDVPALAPQVSWGTNPGQVAPITGAVPEPADESDERALTYMDLRPGTPIARDRRRPRLPGLVHQRPIEDLRAAADIVRGRSVADGVRAMVVPGSVWLKLKLSVRVWTRCSATAGFDWRGAGCSMCLGMNPDILAPGERCASTSNRNFEGRQGRGGRTHLLSPAMAAAAAVTGRLTDVRELAMKPVRVVTGARGRPRPGERRHRPDRPQAVPEADRAHRLRRVPVLGLDAQPDFPLNRLEFQGAPILAAGRNFGSGSVPRARALGAAGLRLRGDHRPQLLGHLQRQLHMIGLLPVELDEADVRELLDRAPDQATIDLAAQTVTLPSGREVAFAIDDEVRERLLNGWDEIALTERRLDEIERYERSASAPGRTCWPSDGRFCVRAPDRTVGSPRR